MANITEQFVTSFSELYIGVKEAVTAASYGDFGTEANVRKFFDADGSTEYVADAAIAIDASVFVTEDNVKLNFINNTDAEITGTIPATSAGLTTAGLIFLSAQVPLVMEIGTLSNEATVIDTPTFGEAFRGKLRGQLDGGQLDTQLYWAPRNFVHQTMRLLAESGAQIVAGIKWKNQAGVAGDSEFVAFDSFVSSFGIDTTFDDVAKVSATLVVDGAEYFSAES